MKDVSGPPGRLTRMFGRFFPEPFREIGMMKLRSELHFERLGMERHLGRPLTDSEWRSIVWGSRRAVLAAMGALLVVFFGLWAAVVGFMMGL